MGLSASCIRVSGKWKVERASVTHVRSYERVGPIGPPACARALDHSRDHVSDRSEVLITPKNPILRLRRRPHAKKKFDGMQHRLWTTHEATSHTMDSEVLQCLFRAIGNARNSTDDACVIAETLCDLGLYRGAIDALATRELLPDGAAIIRTLLLQWLAHDPEEFCMITDCRSEAANCPFDILFRVHCPMVAMLRSYKLAQSCLSGSELPQAIIDNIAHLTVAL